jgi:hypothetical protein
MSDIETIRPQRVTDLPGGVSVSSVHYNVTLSDGAVHRLNETCVFFGNDHSEVRGTYDDHDKIVEELSNA